jgi:hypothetical protein
MIFGWLLAAFIFVFFVPTFFYLLGIRNAKKDQFRKYTYNCRLCKAKGVSFAFSTDSKDLMKEVIADHGNTTHDGHQTSLRAK